MKKQWREEEAVEQEKMDREWEYNLSQGVQKERKVVEKKELPWWLKDTYEVPSNSEDELECEERDKTQKSYAPSGPDMFIQWLTIMEKMGPDDSEGDDDPAYLSDDDNTVKHVDLKKAKEANCFPTSKIPESVKTIVNQIVGGPSNTVPPENARRFFREEENLSHTRPRKQMQTTVEKLVNKGEGLGDVRGAVGGGM